MTDRRGFLKQVIGRTAFALAADAPKFLPASKPIVRQFNAKGNLDKILAELARSRQPFSNLITASAIPKGMGYNFTETFSAVTDSPQIEYPASTHISWSVQQHALMSEMMTTDMPKDHIRSKLQNLAACLVTDLELKDIAEYTRICSHKIILDSNLTENRSERFPFCMPEKTLNPDDLLKFYYQAVADGAQGITAIDGAPILMLILSPDQAIHLKRMYEQQGYPARQIDISKLSPVLRDFLKAHGSTAYAGFVHCSLSMPRLDFIAGSWDERFMYDASSEHASMINPQFVNAAHEDALIFDADVMERMNEEGKDRYGDPRWVKRDGGFAMITTMMAAWKPKVIHNGYAIRCRRIVPMLRR